MILYTSHCPKCNVLKTKLDQKKIDYKTIEDQDIFINKGFEELPKLELDDGTILSFVEANKYINNL